LKGSMQTISSVLAQKEQQYGRSYVPPKNTVVTDEDKLWEQAKRIVDGLTSDYSEALAKGIDRAVSDGIVTESELEAREAKSDKAIKTISDLKYWGWLKQNPSGAMNRTSLLVPKKVHGFELVDLLVDWLVVIVLINRYKGISVGCFAGYFLVDLQVGKCPSKRLLRYTNLFG